jgi:hypothetical protein
MSRETLRVVSEEKEKCPQRYLKNLSFDLIGLRDHMIISGPARGEVTTAGTPWASGGKKIQQIP